MDSFNAQPGKKAIGVDKVCKAEYTNGVDERIKTLSAKLRSLSYRPQPARRSLHSQELRKEKAIGHAALKTE